MEHKHTPQSNDEQQPSRFERPKLWLKKHGRKLLGCGLVALLAGAAVYLDIRDNAEGIPEDASDISYGCAPLQEEASTPIVHDAVETWTGDVRPHIRNLHEGYTHSEKNGLLAESQGIHLKDNQSYVPQHRRTYKTVA